MRALITCLVFAACSNKDGGVDRSGEAGITVPRPDALPRMPARFVPASHPHVINVWQWQWIEAQNTPPGVEAYEFWRVPVRAAKFQRKLVPGDLCGTLEGGTFSVVAYHEYEMLVRYDQPEGRIRGGSICPSGAVSVIHQDTP